MRTVALSLLMAVGLAACAVYPDEPPVRSVKAQRDLQRELAGRVPGRPVHCLPTYQSNDMVTIDDRTILFRSGRTTYLNNFHGSCSNLGSGGYALLTKQYGGSGLCEGDIAQVIDTANGFTVGSCAIGEFVPYIKTAAR